MSRLQYINKLSEGGVENLINSVDYVFFDLDGVIFHNRTCIPGATDCVAKLRKLGKKIGFVTNNTMYPIKKIIESLKPFDATEDELVTPHSASFAYLKQNNFKKDIYVIGSQVLKKLLREAGYKVIDIKNIDPNPLGEHLDAIKELSIKALEICKNVGVVFVDVDFNMTLGSLQVAQLILNHIKDVILLLGPLDDMGPMGDGMLFVGPKFYTEGIQRWTKQKPVIMAKPGLAIKDFLTQSFNILDDNRVLFIGDNVEVDIQLGVNSGYQTCLALTGVTSKSQVEDWKFPEKLKPNYVVHSISELFEKIKDI